MKLFRFGPAGQERPGVVWENKHLDVSAFGQDYEEFCFESDGLLLLSSWLVNNASECQEIPENTRFGSPIKRPSKIICIGLNYMDHAAESGMEAPKEPVMFFKATTALNGPNDNVVIPRGSVKTDWEVELAIVIGKLARYVDIEDNDYSERAFQLERGGQWVKGKSSDTFAPIGPYLVTTDEVKDTSNLRLWLTVNGEIKQNSNTSNMIFDIPFLVHYCSQFMTLLPGDVITTGTPAGVGLGQKPEPQYLKPGDIVELGIEGLGEQRQVLVASR
jgi:2,4-didehydro-3-deoxy-L-rhamnonate hydrolase